MHHAYWSIFLREKWFECKRELLCAWMRERLPILIFPKRIFLPFIRPAVISCSSLKYNKYIMTMLWQFNKWNLYLLVLVSVSKLQNNTGLRCLNFSMNGVGHDGAQYLGRALRVNRTLQHLDICFGRIPEDGCRYLAASLEINDVLQGLKVKTKENKCTLPYGAGLCSSLYRWRAAPSPNHCTLR